MDNQNNYNPWYAQNYVYQQNSPPTIGGCVGYTNSQPQQQYNYYNQQGNIALYNQYYNPYEAQRQREQQEAQFRQQQINRLNFHNDMNKVFYGYEGVEFQHEDAAQQLKKTEEYYSYLQQMQSIKEEHNGFSLDGFQIIQWEPEVTPVEQQPDEPVDFMEWMDDLGYNYAQVLMKKARTQNNDLRKAYDSNSYNRLLNLHNNDSVIDALTSDFTIDDMEVRLPDQFNQEYQERKRRFLEAII
ncbi:MAG: hypothetical protein PHC62_00850 [Candidatus Izemoplasmatales bacterium]|nr:hypothetical protein [Candidatus Izemoplasmatales bacterium]